MELEGMDLESQAPSQGADAGEAQADELAHLQVGGHVDVLIEEGAVDLLAGEGLCQGAQDVRLEDRGQAAAEERSLGLPLQPELLCGGLHKGGGEYIAVAALLPGE